MVVLAQFLQVSSKKRVERRISLAVKDVFRKQYAQTGRRNVRKQTTRPWGYTFWLIRNRNI